MITPFDGKYLEREQLRQEIRTLQLDVERNRDWWQTGRFKNLQQYTEWRSATIGALQQKQRKMAKLNMELREMRRATQLERVNRKTDPQDPDSLLALAFVTLKEFARQSGGAVTERQQAAIDLIGSYLGER